jgi:type VI secretion system secreted protein VgrG
MPTPDKLWVRIQSPFEDELLFYHMEGEEELGQPFRYYLTLLSKNGDLVLADLLGQRVTVELQVPESNVASDVKPRYFDGFVTRFSRQGAKGSYYVYSATVRPWLWLLSQTSTCRIFENKTVPQIIKEVFRANGLTDFGDSLTGDYSTREFVVQYRETDFNFVSRLMEHEGIYYYFTHEANKHTMVLADGSGAHQKVPGYEKIPYLPPGHVNLALPEFIDGWQVGKQIRPGAVVLKDFNFETPKAQLRVSRSAPNPHENAKFEDYDYPGDYRVSSDGETLARIRLEEINTRYEQTRGTGTAQGLAAGALFELTGYPIDSDNREYLITAATLTINGPEYESQPSVSETEPFRCTLVAIEGHCPFRTERRTTRPTVAGPQTATVVGDKGEDITTDKYGRVKVKFHWDRREGNEKDSSKVDKNNNDPDSSCWVRVAQMWAAAKFGAINIPRIGDEVIVDFLDGDPDRPIITGRVYNADNMPPYTLPDNKTQTGIKSRSTKGGNPQNFNELRFEDLKGEEEVYLQAEKDLNILVKNDETRDVGHDRVKNVKNDETSTITGNRTEDVGKDEKIAIHGNRSETVDKDETITISGARSESVGKDETISITGARTETVSKDEKITITGARQVDVGKADTLSVGAGRTQNITGDDQVTVTKKLHFDAGDEIVIKTGDASITMKKDGTIILKGKDVSIAASGKINANASGDVTIKGSKVSTN